MNDHINSLFELLSFSEGAEKEFWGWTRTIAVGIPDEMWINLRYSKAEDVIHGVLFRKIDGGSTQIGQIKFDRK